MPRRPRPPGRPARHRSPPRRAGRRPRWPAPPGAPAIWVLDGSSSTRPPDMMITGSAAAAAPARPSSARSRPAGRRAETGRDHVAAQQVPDLVRAGRPLPARHPHDLGPGKVRPGPLPEQPGDRQMKRPRPAPPRARRRRRRCGRARRPAGPPPEAARIPHRPGGDARPSRGTRGPAPATASRPYPAAARRPGRCRPGAGRRGAWPPGPAGHPRIQRR
jgi:hypothetical protein